MSAEDSDNIEEDMDMAQYEDMVGIDDIEDVPLFWSMKLEPNKEQEIPEPAVPGYIIHITNACFGTNVAKNSRTVVTVDKEDPICVLTQGIHENHSLDLLFNQTANITVKGQKASIVYLTGYIQPPLHSNDEDFMDPMQEDMTEAEIEEALRKQAKQQMVLDDEAGDDKGEDEDEEDTEVVEPPNKKQKTAKGTKSTKNGNKTEISTKKRKSPQQKPVVTDKEDSKNTEKESDKKGSDTKEKKKKNKKMLTMKGGIKYRDMKEGKGDVISKGDKVSVFYVGQTDDKKVFDKSISGNGFEFNFGAGDVIKGWDMGLKGMKVGGKRKLIIPSKLGYGSQGSPPSIPANATLTFTIEVRAVN